MASPLREALDEIIRRRMQGPVEPVPTPPGLLYSLGRVLDFPGRKVREAITGREEATGRDVLRELGLAGAAGRGIDPAGFAAEVLTDPLTLVSGLGTLTKGGRAAAGLKALTPEIKAAAQGVRLATTAEETARATAAIRQLLERRKVLQAAAAAEGVPLRLARGAAAQGRAGQRALVSVGIPFTGIDRPLIRAPRVLGALERTGRGVARLPGVRQGIAGTRRLFDTRFGKDPRARPFFEQFAGRDVRAGQATGRELGELLGTDVKGLAAGAGMTVGDMEKALFKGGEALGQSRRQGRLAARAFARGNQALGQQLVSQGRMAKAPIQALPVQARPFLRRVRTILERQLLSEQKAGVPVSRLTSASKSYMPRVLTPEAQKWLQDPANDRMFRSFLSRRYSTKAGFQEKRLDSLVEEYTADVNDFFRSQGRPDFFIENPAQAVAQRVASGERSKAMAKLFQAVGNEFSVPMGPGMVPWEEIASKAPLGGQVAADMGARLAGKGIPQEIAAELLSHVERLQAPKEIEGLLKTWDTISGVYRAMLTVPFPAFHVRNLLSDTLLSWLGRGTDFRVIPQALRMIRDPAFLRKAEELGFLKGSAAQWIYEQAGLSGKLAKNFPKTAAAGKAGATWVENFTRSWHFLTKKAQGLSDVEAAASVKKYLLDYSDLTAAEKMVGKRAILFYQWPRKVIPRVLGSYLESPQKMALLTRATTQPTIERDEAIPEFAQRGSGIPIGPNEQGDPQYLFGTGSPLEELGKLDLTSPEGGILGGVKALGERTIQQLVPQLRTPIEATTGRDFFTGRDVLDMDKADPFLGRIPGLREAIGFREEKLPGGETRFGADPLALFWLRNLPTSRLQRSAGQLADVVAGVDPKTSSGRNLLQLLTGVKITAQDPLDRARTLKRNLQALAQAFRRTGEVGQFPITYARGEKSERRPEILALMERMRQADKEMKRLKSAPPR